MYFKLAQTYNVGEGGWGDMRRYLDNHVLSIIFTKLFKFLLNIIVIESTVQNEKKKVICVAYLILRIKKGKTRGTKLGTFHSLYRMLTFKYQFS